MEGFILLHRKMLDNAIFYKADYYQIWCYILLKVNHKDVEMIWNNEKKVIKKGSGIFSQKKISEDLKISLGTVHNALQYLKTENQIEIRTTTRYTEIQVVNWGQYQNIENILESRVKAKRKHGETNKHDKHDKHEESMPPTLDEVKKYFREKGSSDSLAIKAFEHYNEAGWKDVNGKPVKNCKQKMNTVWIKGKNNNSGNKSNGPGGVTL